MNKTSLLVACAGLLWFQSCKEIGPGIDFGPGGDDTAYMAEVETAQTRKMLAEEFTGVSCPPCPKGHEVMQTIKTSLSNNVVVIGYHIFNYAQANPVEKDGVMLSKQDFRTNDATEVANSLMGGLGAMPEASFDRSNYKNKVLVGRLDWPTASAERAAAVTKTPVNIHMTNTYDAASREATIKVKLAYTEAVSFRQNMTVAIIEDDIIDAQKTPDTIIKDYTHEHVLRDIITPVSGTQIPAKVDPKVAGKVYERTFKATLGEKWKPEHCKVVVFISNDDAANREVVHAAEVELVK